MAKPKTVKELIRDRYEKLLDRMKEQSKELQTLREVHEYHADLLFEHKEGLDRILEILGAEPQPVDTQFLWPASDLDAEVTLFAQTSQEADDFVFKQQTPNMQLAANAFQDYLIDKYDDVALVNDMGPRHNHRVPDRSKHADTLVILRDPADPSKDIVVDFCWGSSEPGNLYSKLQFLWHEGPYSWWVDNNFPQEEDS